MAGKKRGQGHTQWAAPALGWDQDSTGAAGKETVVLVQVVAGISTAADGAGVTLL
jgi:hypothetical protein